MGIPLMPDLSIGAPGTPDLGTFAGDELDDGYQVQGDAGDHPTPVSLPTVTGLVKSAAAIVAQAIGSQYPERPGIGTMTDDEAVGIATALVSWSTHNPALHDALERSDALAVAFYAFGYAGRTITDIAAVRRERKQADEHRRQGQRDIAGAGEGAGPTGDRDGAWDGAGRGDPDSGGIT